MATVMGLHFGRGAVIDFDIRPLVGNLVGVKESPRPRAITAPDRAENANGHELVLETRAGVCEFLEGGVATQVLLDLDPLAFV